jgi:hypothetical protein
MGVRFLQDRALAAHLASVSGRSAVVGLPGVQRLEGSLSVQSRGLFVTGSIGRVGRGAATQLFYSEPFARAFAMTSVMHWSPDGLLLRTPSVVEVASTRGSSREPCEGHLHLVGDDGEQKWHHSLTLLDCSNNGVAFAYAPDDIWLVVGSSYGGLLDHGQGRLRRVEIEVRRIARLPDGRAIAGARVRDRTESRASV